MSKKSLIWIPVLFGLGSLGLLLLVVTLQPEPTIATVEESRPSPFDGPYILTVTYEAEDGSTTKADVSAQARVPAGETVLIWPATEDREAQLASEPLQLTPGIGVLAFGLGVLLGLVVVFSVNGFGYVPGTGQAGETDPGEIQESRGFYWRS